MQEEPETKWPFFLILRDQLPEMVMAWLDAFSDYGPWNIGSGNILRSKADAIVSPANSYGYMDGGIDLAYRNHFGLGLQTRLQRVLEQSWNGMLPIGEAVIIPTQNEAIPHMIAAPTMERPTDVSTTENAYTAMVAALRAVKRYNTWAEANSSAGIYRILVPGLCTGIGGMKVDKAGKQMRQAVNEALCNWERW
jgi:O-acetyl-ADP-ribose deacetylase (regulator of RNase III)